MRQNNKTKKKKHRGKHRGKHREKLSPSEPVIQFEMNAILRRFIYFIRVVRSIDTN